jgi:hypothetical protein
MAFNSLATYSTDLVACVPIRSNAARCHSPDAQPSDMHNRWSAPLAGVALDLPASTPKKQSAWPLV